MAKVNFSMFPIHRIFPDNYPSACYQLLNLSSAFTAALLRPSRPRPAAHSGYKTAGCIKVIYTKYYKKSNEYCSFLFLGWSGHFWLKFLYPILFLRVCFQGQIEYKIRFSAHCKGALFLRKWYSFFKSSNLQKKMFQKKSWAWNLKFPPISVNNLFKFQTQGSFLENFFEGRLGDLKNESHFLKKRHL